MDEVVERVKDEDAWLIVKRDLYYMPNAQGYTGIRDLAGRYSHDEAKGHVYDAGPRGNSITIVKLTEAPEFTKACYPDLALKHVMKRRDELEAELLRLREGDQPVGKIVCEDSYGLTAHFPNGFPPAGTKLYARPSSPPPGWKLVPVEPTLAMTNACMGLKWPGEGWHATSPTHRVRACATEVYRAMLAAAPETMP